MAHKKAKPEDEPLDPWAYYQSIQLTPEQKTAARAEMQKLVDEAARNGVYENIRGLVGKVQFDMDDLREVRKSKR